jgi:hypothetical protein
MVAWTLLLRLVYWRLLLFLLLLGLFVFHGVGITKRRHRRYRSTATTTLDVVRWSVTKTTPISLFSLFFRAWWWSSKDD